MLGSEFQIIRDISDIRAQLDRVEKKLDNLVKLVPMLLAGELPKPSKQILALVRSGQRLQAIKAYREQSGLPAEQAEAALDALRHRHDLPESEPTQRDVT